MPTPRKILVLTLNAAGNWPPELELIRGLAARGHDVRVISDHSHATQIAEAGASYLPYSLAPERDDTVRPDPQGEPEFLRVLREVFLNPLYADELLVAVEREQPEVLLIDLMLLIALSAAESTRLPTAILWHTVYSATAPMYDALTKPLLTAANPVRAQLGLPPLTSASEALQRSAAILAFTYGSFDMPGVPRPAQLSYVGPLGCLPRPSTGYSLPWPASDARPLILVSYSTSFQDQVATLQRVADALADVPARVLLTLGRAVSASELRLPANIVAETFVPHAEVLPAASLVVTHAGHGTVMAALSAGVPLVCTPMGRDQFSVSALVEQHTLGRMVAMNASVEDLRTTISEVLADGSLRERVRTFARQQDLNAGLEEAIAVVERLQGK